jgi:MFS family permease
MGFLMYPFLLEHMHLDESLIGIMMSAPFLGLMIGCMGMPYLSKKIRRKALIWMPLVESFCLAIFLNGSDLPYIILIFIAFIIGLSSATFLEALTVASYHVPNRLQATAMGAVNTGALIISPCLQPFIGYLSMTKIGMTGALHILLPTMFLAAWIGYRLQKDLH